MRTLTEPDPILRPAAGPVKVGHNRSVARFGLAGIVGALLAWLRARRASRRRRPAQTVIISPRRSTVIAADGAVRSTQAARLTLSRRDMERLWRPASLENLGRTYWRFLSRVTLRLIRVVYGQDERSVVLIGRPLTLLRFEAPDYLLEPGHGRISWRIRDGLLVARGGRGSGWLSLDVTCEDAEGQPSNGAKGNEASDQVSIGIEVEVANFYPAIAAGFSTAVYEATQAFVHVLVTHAFLRSLATLELAKSKIGRFSSDSAGDAALGTAPQRQP